MMNPKPVNMKRGGDSDMDLYVREKYFKKIGSIIFDVG